MKVSLDNKDFISPDMVKKIAVSRLCAEGFPCKHWCDITLTDGRSQYVQLSWVEIATLIREIAQEKIFESNESCSAFDCAIHFDYSQFRQRISWNPGDAKDILARIFEKNISGEPQSLVDMVQKVQMREDARQTNGFPVIECEIILIDGRKCRVQLNQWEALVVCRDIPCEKIEFQEESRGFFTKAIHMDFIGRAFYKERPDWKKLSAEDILVKIFFENSAELPQAVDE